jgi:hypothetical protein
LDKARVVRLRRERQQLVVRLARVNAALTKVLRAKDGGKAASASQVDRWLEQLSAGLPDLPALPADFSRADLYDDHD